MFICQPLTTTNIIEITGILVSLITSIVAIIISVKTLKQNSKMISNSTRPYIAVYSQTTIFRDNKYYLVVKNFGQTGAMISSFKCDYDLSSCSYNPEAIPFANFAGTFIAPGQSFITNIDHTKLNDVELHFSLEYKDGDRTYSDCFTINPKASSGLVRIRTSINDEHLRTISYSLQDLVEKQL